MASVKSVSIGQVRGLTAAEISALKAQGITTTARLLAAAPDAKAESALARKAGLKTSEIHEAVNRADLIRVTGLGPATADLFEDAGVNSVAELSHRNAANLTAALQAYAAAHPGSEHVPSQATVAQLINGAKLLVTPAPQPLTVDQARPVAAKALDAYIDDVLFNPANPDGAAYRSAALDGHTQAEQDATRAQLHASVQAFVGNGTAPYSESDEVVDGGATLTFTGRLDGLYTEVDVGKDGQPGRVMVEID